jgi:hypothetical protein
MTLVLTLCYVTPLVVNYFFIRKSYSVGGKWETSEPDFSDVFRMVIPVLNTLIMFYFVFDYIGSKDNISSKFFQIKK